ncbi:MAG: AmmeMemoRadiSam system protein B [Thermodesulfovibrionales bacterium]|jgi:AmmeMemoRadiSam system protein B/AmmeMemoRadiSam system protein A
MKFRNLLLLIAFCLSVLFIFGCSERVKEPAVAGSFYPSDEKSLRETVNSFLATAERRPVDGKLIALIAPHAGYQFSGQIAAYAYKHLAEREINTVILIGPSHHVAFNGASVYTEGSMKTPLGNVKIDTTIAQSLINEKANVSFNPDTFEKEHSIEVQLPFLQQMLKNFKIVPILIGSPTKESFEYLTGRLIEILRKDEKTIIIASTDLSHYHDYDTATTMDKKMIDAVQRMSLEDVERYLMSGEGEMCGGYPVIFTMAVARGVGATNGLVYKYANSGDVTGDRSRVVGYSAIGLYKSGLSKTERDELISLAKNAIVNYVINGKLLEIDVRDERLRANGATFVTINRGGNLRGCIGNIQPVMPLYRSVIMNAIAACSKDPRFPPMNKEELKDMDIEVSVLSPLEPLTDIKSVEIGKHGLYLVKGQNSGLLLPQVAANYKWDVNTFLEQVSFKAGLPKDAWKSANLYSFSAEIIR